MKRLTTEQKRFETDRLSLIHKIVFNAEIEKWELVDKYKKLYKEIYGDISLFSSVNSYPPLVVRSVDKDKEFWRL